MNFCQKHRPQNLPAHSTSLRLIRLALLITVSKRFFIGERSVSPSSIGLEGDDFPHFLPVELPPAVLMSIEESVHYSLTDPEAEKEWLYNSPWGAGSYRLESDSTNRGFFVVMFHQLHCLRRMRAYFTSEDPEGPGHVQHCLSFLRSTVELLDSFLFSLIIPLLLEPLSSRHHARARRLYEAELHRTALWFYSCL